MPSPFESHPVVSRDEWLEHRKRLLLEEKEHTRRYDELCRHRRELPWVRVDKPYRFTSPAGPVTLVDLFAGRSQLLVQHFMFAPGWEEGCVGCSFCADHVDAARQHFEQHDVSFAAVSRAPLAEIEAFRRRMGWRFTWVSAQDSDFNADFHVSFPPEEVAHGRVYYNYEWRDFTCEELPGLSVFHRNAAGDVFHTYSAYGRGDEPVVGAYMYLDFTPKGRNENGPNFNLTDWVRHHDRYGADGHVATTGRYVGAPGAAAEPAPAAEVRS